MACWQKNTRRSIISYSVFRTVTENSDRLKFVNNIKIDSF